MAKPPLAVGSKAPTFTLLDQNDQAVTPADLAGKWAVLYFYPKDDTPGCTTEACEFTSHLKEFEGLDARVMGVSPDSIASHREFIAKHRLAIDLLSDPDHQVLEKYGAWGEKTMYGKKVEGVIRSTVLVDPTGKVAYHWTNVKAAGHAEAVRQRLVELQGA
jgi:peroxiredoxin Q/BCP